MPADFYGAVHRIPSVLPLCSGGARGAPLDGLRWWSTRLARS
jgi:hypothetical protein